MDRRFALLLPSLTLLVLTAIGWWFWPPPATEPRLAWPYLVVVGLATGGALLSGATLLERTVPSFRRTSRRLERLVRDLRLPPGGALLAALVSGVSEELFFRGWLLPTIGLWGQALLFMLLHPAGRAGWSYTLYTGVAGLAFGIVTLSTGSLWPALIAHVAVNLHGFSSASGAGERARGGAPGGARAAERPPARVVDVRRPLERTRRSAPAAGREDAPAAGREDGLPSGPDEAQQSAAEAATSPDSGDDPPAAPADAAPAEEPRVRVQPGHGPRPRDEPPTT